MGRGKILFKPREIAVTGDRVVSGGGGAVFMCHVLIFAQVTRHAKPLYHPMGSVPQFGIDV